MSWSERYKFNNHPPLPKSAPQGFSYCSVYFFSFIFQGCPCNWNITLQGNLPKSTCRLSLHRFCIDLSFRNTTDLFRLHMTGSFRCKTLIYDLVSYSQVNHYHSVKSWPFLWTIILRVVGRLNTIFTEVHEKTCERLCHFHWTINITQ